MGKLNLESEYNAIQELYDKADNDYQTLSVGHCKRHMTPRGREMLNDFEALLSMSEHHDFIEEYTQNALSYISFRVLELQREDK